MEGRPASNLSNNENLVVSCEDSSSPRENEIQLGLTLGLNQKGYKDYEDSSSISSSCLSITAERKRTDDSMAATSGQVVGWPPIRTYRINNTVNNQGKTLLVNEDANEEISQEVNKNQTGVMRMFVKVSMDGIPIGRKIDLNVHKCYGSLSNTLEEMFLKPKTGSSMRERDGVMETRLKIPPDGSSGLVLTYEDKEGDWMLVGDVPWRMFISSVRRLRIMKTSEATGTGQMIL